MEIESQRDSDASHGTVVDARQPASPASWWLLGLAFAATLAVLQHERIARWFAPRAQALLEDMQTSPPPRPRASSGSEAATPVAAPPQPQRSSAQPHVAQQQAAPAAAEQAPADTSPVDPTPAAAAPPQIQPLYPVPAQPATRGPEGRAGLVEALRAGTLRPATGSDLARWRSRYTSTHGHAPGSEFDDRLRMMEAYVIQGEMTLPGGLHGAHAVVFLLDADAPYPHGDAGHSVILDLGSGACIGVVCGSMLPTR